MFFESRLKNIFPRGVAPRENIFQSTLKKHDIRVLSYKERIKQSTVRLVIHHLWSRDSFLKYEVMWPKSSNISKSRDQSHRIFLNSENILRLWSRDFWLFAYLNHVIDLSKFSLFYLKTFLLLKSLSFYCKV